MKITILLEYPDDANPVFSSGMEVLGGKVVAVQFSDAFAELSDAETKIENMEYDEKERDS